MTLRSNTPSLWLPLRAIEMTRVVVLSGRNCLCPPNMSGKHRQLEVLARLRIIWKSETGSHAELFSSSLC